MKTNTERSVEETVQHMVYTFFRTNTVYEDKSWDENSVTPAFFCGCYEGDIGDHLDVALPKLKDWLTQTLQAERQKRKEMMLQAEKEILRCVTGEDDNCYYLRVAKDSPLFITQPNNPK
jgi:hypothetical protein